MITWYRTFRPTKYSYQMQLQLQQDATRTATPDTNWNTAIANENFRKSWYYGLDATPYLCPRRTSFDPHALR